MARASLDEEIAVTAGVCRSLGLGSVEPLLLKAAHHSLLSIAPLGIVARVQSSEEPDAAWQTADREIAVARHLAGRGAPAIAPLDERLAGPHRTPIAIVTLWPHVAQGGPTRDSDALLAARSLAAVHDALRSYRGALPPYTAALDRCWKMLDGERVSSVLSAADRDLLRARYRQLRAAIEAKTGALVPLHGDAHLGNLLTGERGPVWIDFEDACIGPREWDIAALPPEAWLVFDGVDETRLRHCVDLRSVCVAVWCSADVTRNSAMREAIDYHLGRLRGATN